MIVVYLSPADEGARQAIREAIGQKVTFRDPALFEPSQADPLDTVVYAAEDARAIHRAYRHLGITPLNVGDTPLPMPPRVYGARRTDMPVAMPVVPEVAGEAPPVATGSAGVPPDPPAPVATGEARGRNVSRRQTETS